MKVRIFICLFVAAAALAQSATAALPPPAPGPVATPPQIPPTLLPTMPSPAPTVSAVPAPSDSVVAAQAKEWLMRLQTGNIDRSQLSPNMNTALSPTVVHNAQSQYHQLGPPTTFTFTGKQQLANGDTEYDYRVVFKAGTVTEKFVLNSAGKIDAISLIPVTN